MGTRKEPKLTELKLSAKKYLSSITTALWVMMKFVKDKVSFRHRKWMRKALPATAVPAYQVVSPELVTI